MSQTAKSRYTEEVAKIVSDFNEQEQGNQDAEQLHTMPLNEIDVYVEEDRITLIPKRLHGKPVNERDIIDSDAIPQDDLLSFFTNDPALQAIPQVDEEPTQPAPKQPLRTVDRLGYAVIVFYLFLCLASIAFQLNLMLNPAIATIILIPKSQTISLNASVQLGRLLPPTTLSQSKTVQATGKGHQDAKAATGSITFYNGQLQSVFIPAGTILVGNDGVQIITDQDATLPAANLPQVPQAIVSAHAMNTGSSGNIPAYDISQGCCNGVKAVNTASFSGGQDERNFQTVTNQDIANAATPLKTALAQSMQGALTGQLQSGEALVIPTCTPKVTSDHQIGDEATQVKVTLSETCSGVAYDTQALASSATQLLSAQAVKKLGTGYSLLGDVQVTTNAATVTGAHPIIAFSCNGVWVYALSDAAQEHIKDLIKGKTTQDALHLLESQPGIERVSTSWDVNTKLPKDTQIST